MKVKKGDTVRMTTGKDNGKTGKVLGIQPKTGKIIVEGLNIVKRHRRPRKQNEKGQIVDIPSAVDLSNVMVVCPQCSKASRIGYEREGKDRSRVCKKCGHKF